MPIILGRIPMLNRRYLLQGAAALALVPTAATAQAKTEFTMSRQPGILYMPLHVIEKHKLIEKHAERLGIKGATIKWIAFSGGGPQQDALVSGNVDVINTGTGNLLLLWDKTRGGVKGVVATSALPLKFVSRDPRIKSLKDLGEGDRIAVPTVKVSTQAILLQMAAGKMFGADQWNKFDPMTVQMGHPDAYISMKNASHEVKNHFGAPPYDFYELKEVPGAHQITTSSEIIGGPLTQGQFITTTKFADANPKFIQALRAAAEEAKSFIEKDVNSGVDAYKEINNDKTDTNVLIELLRGPGMNEWNIYPQGTMKFAAHLNKVGSIKTVPGSWKDYYLSIAHDLPGN
jgi:NitT/TauT family transport system substrate-binding protein